MYCNSTSRALSVEQSSDISNSKSGNVIGKIYETDIKTSIYDVVIPTYNIGGKTAVVIETIDTITPGEESITDKFDIEDIRYFIRKAIWLKIFANKLYLY